MKILQPQNPCICTIRLVAKKEEALITQGQFTAHKYDFQVQDILLYIAFTYQFYYRNVSQHFEEQIIKPVILRKHIANPQKTKKVCQ